MGHGSYLLLVVHVRVGWKYAAGSADDSGGVGIPAIESPPSHLDGPINTTPITIRSSTIAIDLLAHDVGFEDVGGISEDYPFALAVQTILRQKFELGDDCLLYVVPANDDDIELNRKPKVPSSPGI